MTRTSSLLAEEWAVAHPWCSHLQRMTDMYVFGDASQPEGESLSVTVSIATTHEALQWESVRRCREGFALLALIALVDSNAWRALLQHCCCCSGVRVEESPDRIIPPRFAFGFGKRRDPTSVCDASFDDTFFSAFGHVVMSDAYTIVSSVRNRVSKWVVHVALRIFARLSLCA